MSFLEDARQKIGEFVGKEKDEHAARQVKAESDIEPDPKVAGSRAGDDGDDGNYVGRTNPQFDAEVQETGAEARSEASRDGTEGR
ncbi:hypothetical protein BH09ACT8_BH09ACT8_03840 [soil metagenome]